MKNLASFLAEWGISIGDSLVLQSNTEYSYGNMEYVHLQQIQDTDYAGSAYGSSLITYDAYIRPVQQLWEGGTKGSVEQKVLIKSYDGAYLRPISTLSDDEFDKSGAESGSFNDAVAAYQGSQQYSGSHQSCGVRFRHDMQQHVHELCELQQPGLHDKHV